MMKNQKLMDDNRRYWKHRLNEAEKQRQKRDERLDRQMQRMYVKAYRDIQKELDAFYGRYMKRTGLSAEEVHKAAKDFDIKAFEERAKYYVENRDFSPRANTELALYNFKMRYNQLELLQANLDITLIELGAKEESAVKKAKLEEMRRTYKANAGILGLSVPSEERMKQVAQSAINKPYYGAHFSERIWSGHINPLRKYLNDRVSLTILSGQSPELLARDLKKRFDVTTNEARRLAVTEVGFMETEAQKLSYVDAGFERYGIQPEANACPQCRAIVDECEAEGGFLTAGMNPGLNAPLFHPWCRCGTYPIVPRDELERLLSKWVY